MGKKITKIENKSELDQRVDEFNKELQLLFGKYNLMIGAVPIILPNGTLAAKPSIFDNIPKKPVGEVVS